MATKQKKVFFSFLMARPLIPPPLNGTAIKNFAASLNKLKIWIFKYGFKKQALNLGESYEWD